MDERLTDDQITLRLWEGNSEALADLVMRDYGVIVKFIQKRFPRLRSVTAEDVVSEAIRRFWKIRDKYEGDRPIRQLICGFAINVAREASACRLNWMKAASKVVSNEVGLIWVCEDQSIEDRLDQMESKVPGLAEKVRKALETLSPLHRDILEAFAFAETGEVDAGTLGRELGMKHKGQPYPASTIRGYKKRANEAFAQALERQEVDTSKLGRKR